MVFLKPYLPSTCLLVSLSNSLSFDIHHIHLHIFLYLLSPLATSSIVFHLFPCSATSTSWYNQIISTFNLLFFGTYNFSFFNTKSPSTCHLSSCNTLTPIFFISSTTLITSSSFPLAILFFPLYLLLVLLLLLQLNYEFIILQLRSGSHCFFLHLLFSLVSC